MLKVGAAAIVRRGERGWELLSARRTEPPTAAGLWEFPGGKVEADETPEQCVRREIREELGVEIVLHEQLMGPNDGWWPLLPNIAFAFWLCTLADDQQPQLLEDHDALAWLGVDALESVPWIPADLPLVREIGAMLARADASGVFPSFFASLPKHAESSAENSVFRQ